MRRMIFVLTLTLTLGLLASDRVNAQTGICDRTFLVRVAIINEIESAPACAAVTAQDLSGVRFLEFNNAGITSLKSGDFAGLTNLKRLWLYQNQLQTLPADVFAGLTSLEELRLNDNPLQTLPAGLFAGLSSLRYLRLSGLPLQTLPAGLFAGLSSLRYLDLRGGIESAHPFASQLQTLPAGLFAGLTSLRELNITSLPLQTLPADVFAGLTSLLRMGLSRDQIPLLTAGVFAGLTSLRHLSIYGTTTQDVFGDPISSGLPLQTLPAGLFAGLSSLRHLYLVTINLETLQSGDFTGLTSLENLHLRNNRLTTLPAGVFDGLTSLKWLDLSKNQLQTLPAGVFDGLTSLREVTLRGNPGGFNDISINRPPDPVGFLDSPPLRPPGDGSPYLWWGGDFDPPVIGGTRVIYGSACDANEVVIEVNGQPHTVTYGIERQDTQALCGDTDNGFEWRFVWNSLGDGEHVVALLVDGVRVGETLIRVTTAHEGTCQRSTWVRDQIDANINHNVSGRFRLACDEVIAQDLATVTALFAPDSGIELQSGDFAGLTSLKHLRLPDSQLQTLPAGVFAGLSSLETLYLQDNNLQTLPAGIFADLSSLEELRLERNQLQTLPAGAFAGLSNLVELELRQNQLQTLPAGVFAGLSSLETLYLHDNQLQTLPAGVFDGLPSLETLYLNDNQLQTLPAGVFAGLSSLEALGLYNNQLQTLPAGVFAGLSSLEALGLGNNQLQTLPAGVFAGLSSLGNLNLSSNPLQTISAQRYTGSSLVALLMGELGDGGDGGSPEPVGSLESPGANSLQSGVGVISGWVCEANEVVIELNGQAHTAAYGTERLDTAADCGDTDNGFELMFNWNLLDDGEHTVVVLVDGVELDRATVTVTTEDSPEPVGYLENPGANSFQSGVGVISGWVCEADEVVIELNGQAQPAAYGTERLDTAADCGDTDNGFGLLFNWNRLGYGGHTVVALVDGVELARATVTVTTLGEEFLQGVTGTCEVEDFPMEGETETLVWQQTKQNFVLAGGSRPSGENRAGVAGVGYLENPGANSFQSGIGVLSGWVCDAERVEIVLGDLAPMEAGYGTERLDTLDACGDTDNGFGLLFNWNRLGEGEHVVVAYVDDEELGRAMVRVTTLGEEFVRGAAGECVVEDFPMEGETVTLEWQESQQNFVIVEP